MESSNLKDYYKILGIPKTATFDEIKKAFRNKARKFHPDVCKLPNAHQIFIGIAEAYETLIDPASRLQYDYLWDEQNQQRTRQAQQNPPRPPGNGQQQHTTYSQAYEDFTQMRNHANSRAQTYANMSMDDFMSSVFGYAYKAGKAAVSHFILGDKHIRARNFYDYLYLGIKAYVLLFFLSLPVFLIGFFIFPSYMVRCWRWILRENDGRFIGLYPLLKGLLLLTLTISICRLILTIL